MSESVFDATKVLGHCLRSCMTLALECELNIRSRAAQTVSVRCAAPPAIALQEQALTGDPRG